VGVALRIAEAQPAANGSLDEVVLTAEGYAKLEEEHRRLTTLTRPEATARLSQALQVAGDLADNPEYLDARAELDLVEERIDLVERRLHAARVLRPDESSSQVVSLGSRVVLEDLDDGTRERYVLVSSAESNPAEGRLSSESPVGRAIAGHHRGDVVDARAPHRVRHLRIVDLGAGPPIP
jgi:transcription elongation factor GreA